MQCFDADEDDGWGRAGEDCAEKLCENACSGAGLCDHAEGTCSCLIGRYKLDCSGLSPVLDGEKQIRGSGGSLDPPGPLPTYLHTVYMAYSECLPTRLDPLAERTSRFFQVLDTLSPGIGPVVGGTTVTIFGWNFMADADIRCRFWVRAERFRTQFSAV
jgi:hypothetical protein